MQRTDLRQQTRHGYTLFETMITLVIIAMISAMALPRLDAFKYRADAAAVLVRSLIMQAQRDAITQQHDLIVSIDTVKHRMIIGYDANNDGAIVELERIRILALPENNRFAKPPANLGNPGLNDYGAIRAEALKTVSGFPSVTFRRDGSVSSALELYSTSARAKITDWRATSVVQATGRSEYFRYNGIAWIKPAK